MYTAYSKQKMPQLFLLPTLLVAHLPLPLWQQQVFLGIDRSFWSSSLFSLLPKCTLNCVAAAAAAADPLSEVRRS
jgi:hypothetical protein